MKLWSGRFTTQSDALLEEFNASIGFDSRLYAQDIQGSIAHARMLKSIGVLTGEEFESIETALNEILDDIKAGKIEFTVEAEDIHMNIETLLTARIGDAGKKLHTARSRNDQVALDMRLFVKETLVRHMNGLAELIRTLYELASAHLNTIMPGYTHLQKAQPVTLAHHLGAYIEMFLRDAGRMRDCLVRCDALPLGAGALAGTTYPLDREMVAQELGFARVTRNSMDAVSDRDFCVEYLACAGICMMHFSRFCEELILWGSDEFGFVTLSDAFSTGSSIMPQKKNPDIPELIRGKTGRVYGDLLSLLTTLKGLPLAYNKDMQEDKEPVFDTADTLDSVLNIFPPMLKSAVFNSDAMKKGAARGFTNATDAADYLVKKGLPFRDAHEVIGKLVRMCLDKGCDLASLAPEDYLRACPLFDKDIYTAIDLDTCVKERNVTGGPAPDRVEAALDQALEEAQALCASNKS